MSLPVTLILTFVLTYAADAAVLCTSNGRLAVREECKRKESLVDPVALGLQGPPGEPGPAGPVGAAGGDLAGMYPDPVLAPPEPVQAVQPGSGTPLDFCPQDGAFCGDLIIFQRVWENYGQGAEPVGFWKDRFGVVHIQGSARSAGAGTSIFKLPPAYRPATIRWFAAPTGFGAPTMLFVSVDPEGIVATTSDDMPFISLDGISYRP